MKKLFLLLALMSMVAVGCTELDSLIDNNKTERPDNGSGEDNNIPNNEIWYTTTNGEVVEPYSGEENNYADALTTFGANIISNTYIDGKGVITFDGDVATIGDWAFYECSSLTSVTILDSVTTIGDLAFYDCSSLTSVTIGDSVTTIEDYAFYYCTSLTSVYCEPTTPPTGGTDMFYNVSSDCKIYVPMESVAAYKNAQGWSDYASDIVGYNFENGVVVTPKPANNEIWYTNGSTTEATTPFETTAFGANIVSNTYDDEKECWVIKFDGEVTTIGERAFAYYCYSLTSVTIPDSVTTIGYKAFNWCQSLTSVTIGDSVTTIGDEAFGYCESLTSVTIPDSVTKIGSYAFYWCESLTSVTIGDSVTSIGECAFYWCESLQAFNGKFASEDSRCLIIDGVLNSFAIGCGATEYTIPDSVTTIGEHAFDSCESLTSITIPDSVTKIGSYAFNWCESLTSVTIPDSVTTIGESAFTSCFSLQAFNGKFASEDSRCLIIDGELNSFAIGCGATEYTIPDSVTTIGGWVFGNCYDLTSVTIPDSVTTIGDSAFRNCSSLTSVTIGDSVTTIGEHAFSWCQSLTSVTIGDSVTAIGDFAFDSCYSLTSVYCKSTTPPTVSITMGDWSAFDSNASGRVIYVPMESVEAYKSAEGWSDYASDIVGYDFENGVPGTPKPANNEIWYTNGSTTMQTTPTPNAFGANIVSNTYDAAKECWVIKFDGKVTTIGNDAFYNCHSLTSVTIPDSVTTIGHGAFLYCDSLTSVTIPDSVTTIGNGAFQYCDSLTSITIPNSVTTIGYASFANCSNLTNVTIGDSVTTIGGDAFRYCSSLTSVTIPNSVNWIGDSAFANNNNLESVYCKATTPPSLGGTGVFTYNASGRVIYVPMESVEAYKSAQGWSEYADAIVGYNF